MSPQVYFLPFNVLKNCSITTVAAAMTENAESVGCFSFLRRHGASKSRSGSALSQKSHPHRSVSVNNEAEGPPPLPPFWKELTDHQGRTYYKHEYSKATRWERPSPPDALAKAKSHAKTKASARQRIQTLQVSMVSVHEQTQSRIAPR